MKFSIEKSIVKAIKYPIFGWVFGWILRYLGIVVAGIGIQFPKSFDIILRNPEVMFGLAIVIFVYDVLKHRFEVRLP